MIYRLIFNDEEFDLQELKKIVRHDLPVAIISYITDFVNYDFYVLVYTLENVEKFCDYNEQNPSLRFFILTQNLKISKVTSIEENSGLNAVKKIFNEVVEYVKYLFNTF